MHKPVDYNLFDIKILNFYSYPTTQGRMTWLITLQNKHLNILDTKKGKYLMLML